MTTEEELSVDQKKAEMDLTVIGAATLIPLILYAVFGSRLMGYCRDDGVNLWLRLGIVAAVQFGLAGLGMSIVMIWRRESFRSYGLSLSRLPMTLLLSAACFVPALVFMVFTRQIRGYLPFGGVFLTRSVLDMPFPQNIAGYALICAVWGFFEGFSYVVVSRKINERFGSGRWWLNRGAIVCGIACILIHGTVGFSLAAVIGMLTTFFLIYGMLVVRDYTENSWGCVFIFLFLWNAF